MIARARFSMVALLTTLIAAVFLLASCATGPQIAFPQPYSEQGIRVVVTGYYAVDDGSVLGISGTATNESGRNFRTCMLSFDVLDATGAKVSAAIASTIGFTAGQTWRFQATFLNPFSVQFKSIAPGASMCV